MGQIVSSLCSSNSDAPQNQEQSQESSATSASVQNTDKKTKLNQNDFEIINSLGHGAFGNVYQVKKKTNHKEFAMKAIKKSKLQHSGLDLQMVIEKNILLKSKHPFLVNLKYSFQSDKKLYLVMDYCQGGELLSYIQLFAKLGLSQKISRFIGAEVLLGLEYMHNKMKIMYRDLKPENILVCNDGHLKIADFGLAKHFKDQNEKTRGVCGTLEYLAPEIICCLKSDFPGYSTEVDIWAFGVFLYEVIVGKPPFTHPQRNADEIMKKIMKNQVKYPSGLKEDAKDLISKCLQTDPNARPSWEDIKRHEFFSSIDWDKLYKKEIESPIRKHIPQYKEFKKEARPIIETQTEEVFKSIKDFYYAPMSLVNQNSNQIQ